MERHRETWVEHDERGSPAPDREATQNQSPIQVYVRSRPLLERDLVAGFYSLLAVQPSNHVHLTHPTMRWGGGRFGTKTFQADGVFSESVTSEEVYSAMNVRNQVESCMRTPGSALSIVAYGQTGSGKTYTTTAIEGMIPQIPLKVVLL